METPGEKPGVFCKRRLSYAAFAENEQDCAHSGRTNEH